MIKAIVEGRKTQTRRVLNPQPFMRSGILRWIPSISQRHGIVDINLDDHADLAIPYARYQVGEVVYIKEPYLNMPWGDIMYPLYFNNRSTVNPWKSPLFMPEKLARYFIKITDVKPQRLHDITEEDCVNEGLTENINDYALLWDSINPKYQWDTNPWLWRYEFLFWEKERVK